MKSDRAQLQAVTAVAAVMLWLAPQLVVHGQASGPVAGRVVAWGDNAYGQCDVPEGLDDVIAVAGGGAHSLALKQDGTVVAWGWDSFGQSTVPDGLTDVVAIAGRGVHSLAVKKDGTVVAWGMWQSPYEIDHYPVPVPRGLNGVKAIAAGPSHNLAVKADGTVVAWGRGNEYGQLTVPEGLNGVVAVAAGRVHSLALREDGTVVAWGAGGPEQYGGVLYNRGQSIVPDDLDSVVAIEAPHSALSVALKSNGTIVTWPSFILPEGPLPPPELSGVVSMSWKGSFVLGLLGDRTVEARGRMYSLDDPVNTTWQPAYVPAGLTDVVAIAAGNYHALAIVAEEQPLLTIRPSGGQLELTWPLWATGYQLEMKDNLATGSWVPAPGLPITTAMHHVVTAPIPESHRFYRLWRW